MAGKKGEDAVSVADKKEEDASNSSNVCNRLSPAGGICGRIFKYSSSLKTHIKFGHEDWLKWAEELGAES